MEASALDKLREEVAATARELFNRGLTNPWEGNVSARVGKDEMLVTPSYNNYADLKAEDIVHIKFDGTQLSKGRPASKEFRMHKAIYEDRDKAKCVIHAHSPHATALSILRKPIPPIMEEQCSFLGGAIPVAEQGKMWSDDLSQKAVVALGKGNATLLANHGMVVCGAELKYCLNMVTLVEKLARVYLLALQTGEEPATIPQELVDEFKIHFEGFTTAARKKTKPSPKKDPS